MEGLEWNIIWRPSLYMEESDLGPASESVMTANTANGGFSSLIPKIDEIWWLLWSKYQKHQALNYSVNDLPKLLAALLNVSLLSLCFFSDIF